MDKSQKGAAAVNQKEKSSFLDDDIGKDFLTSWKLMSVTKDDAMDFGFDTVSSGKNKAFNFDKLDMDFGLDGEFDKLSSFKVDMSDFDLPSPSKKVAKAKEVSEDKSSTGKPQVKKSQFNYFDFNEMDNFDFESSLGIVGKTSTKNIAKTNISSDKTEQQSSKIQISDDAGTVDNALLEILPASKDVDSTINDALQSGTGHLVAKENDRERSISPGAPISSHGAKSSENVVTKLAEASDQHARVSVKEISLDIDYQDPKLDFRGPSLVGDTKRNAISDIQTQNTDQLTEVYAAQGRIEHVNDKMINTSSSCCEISPLKNSSPLNATSASSDGGNRKSVTDVLTQTMDGNIQTVENMDLEENSIESISRKDSHDMKTNMENPNYVADLPPALLCSESAEDKGTLTSHSESGSYNLNFDKGEQSEHLIGQASSLETKSHPLDGESMGSVDKSLATETENGLNPIETQVVFESDQNVKSLARKSSKGEDVLAVVEKNINHFENLREHFTSDVLPNDCKLSGTQSFGEEAAKKGKPILSESYKNIKSQNTTGVMLKGEGIIPVGENNRIRLNNLSEPFTSGVLPNNCKWVETSQLFGEVVAKMRKPVLSIGDKNAKSQYPTGLPEKQQAKTNSPTFVKSKLLSSSMESIRNPEIKLVEGNKVSLVRSPKKIPALTVLKISNTRAADKASDTNAQREISSQQNPKHDLKLQNNAASSTALPQKGTEKKSQPEFSLKRKAFELPNSNLACLKPLKRLPSPQNNRDFQEPPTQVVEEKISRTEKKFNSLNLLFKASSVRDVTEPLKRVEVKESFRRIEGEKISTPEVQTENDTQSNPNSVPVCIINSPQKVNLMDLELSSMVEDDGFVEKAEAYAKELEDICNMLKKKHDEAKEILVRALVNNNNLLMLNHPIYEEKIYKVQKFAAELMSRE